MEEALLKDGVMDMLRKLTMTEVEQKDPATMTEAAKELFDFVNSHRDDLMGKTESTMMTRTMTRTPR